MKTLLIFATLIGGLLLSFNSVHASAFPNLAPTPMPASIGDKWGAEKDERTAQATAVKSEQTKIENEAAPMYAEQKSIEEKEKPFLAIKKTIDANWATYDAGAPGYKAQCNSHTFQMPAEQAAFNACNTLHAQREATRIQLKKQEDENYANLKPLLDKWMKLETQMEPHMLAWKDLKKKLDAINKEIQRLDALMAGSTECQRLRAKAKTNAPMPDSELEKLHQCESTPFDGTDPNLPPLTWRPPPFKATPN